MFVDSLAGYTGSPELCFPLECGVVHRSLRRSAISLKHVSLWCLFSDPHLTTHQSNNRCPTKKSMQTTPAYLKCMSMGADLYGEESKLHL